MRGDTLPTGPQAALDNEDQSNRRLRKLQKRVVAEMKRVAVMFFYLWIMFGLFVIMESIILRRNGISFSAQGFAVVNAFVLAKVMLVAEDLNLAKWLRGRPLIYPILQDSFLLAILFICFHVVEKLVVGFVKGGAGAQSLPAIGGGGLAGLACVAIILFIALMPFFGFRYIGRELGERRLREMLFGTGAKVSDKL